MPWKAIWRLPWITCPFASRQRNRERAASQFSLPNKVKYNDNIPPWCTLCSRAKLNFWLQTASFFDTVIYSVNLMYLSVMLYFKWHLLLFCFKPTVYWILFYGRPYVQKWYECSIDDQNHDRYRIEFFDRSLRMKIFMVEIIDWLMRTTIAILSKQGLYTRNTIAVVERKIGNELWRSKGSKRRGVDWMICRLNDMASHII